MSLGAHHFGYDPRKPDAMRVAKLKDKKVSIGGGLPRIDRTANLAAPGGGFKAIRGVPR